VGLLIGKSDVPEGEFDYQVVFVVNKPGGLDVRAFSQPALPVSSELAETGANTLASNSLPLSCTSRGFSIFCVTGIIAIRVRRAAQGVDHQLR